MKYRKTLYVAYSKTLTTSCHAARVQSVFREEAKATPHRYENVGTLIEKQRQI